MAYKGAVIFVGAPALERIRERYLDDDQYRLLQLALMTNPESADRFMVHVVSARCAGLRTPKASAADCA
jgi:hypothetical protein